MSPKSGFLLVNEVVPRLKVLIPRAVHRVGSEDIDELVADGTLTAAKMLHNAETRGKEVPASSIAYYTVLKLRCGRRSMGGKTSDAYAVIARMRGESRL